MFSLTIMEGRLVADPELRKTPSGMAIASFVLACEDDYKKNNEKSVTFIPCSFFGKIAENVAKYFRKGKAVIVSGRLQQHEYSQGDQKKVGYQLTSCSFSFPIGGKAQDSDKTEEEPKEEPKKSNLGDIDMADEDLPF